MCNGVVGETSELMQKKGGTNVAGVPVRRRNDPWSFDDNISTSTPMLRGGQDQLFKVRTYTVVFERSFRFSALLSTAFSFLTAYVQIRSSSKIVVLLLVRRPRT
jgi:hypothetical protein